MVIEAWQFRTALAGEVAACLAPQSLLPTVTACYVAGSATQ
jgi:hypothetical protein